VYRSSQGRLSVSTGLDGAMHHGHFLGEEMFIKC